MTDSDWPIAPATIPALALGFATIDRPHTVQRIVHSARRYFPDIKLYVADQSRSVGMMQPFYEANGVTLVRVPYDAGVSAARNALVKQISEPYFVLCDDDMFFSSETNFEDAVRLLEARDDIGVVGGKLYEIEDEGIWPRHWELYLEYDQRNKMLVTFPIYWMAPRPVEHEHRVFYLCDAVLNFAVFRRAIFSDRVKWDERFTCNGEHEDFYLNLKLNSEHRVAYLPSMVGFHHHPSAMRQYEDRLRSRLQGWRLFMEKWGLEQQLEDGSCVRPITDVAEEINRDLMRERFALGRSSTTLIEIDPRLPLADVGTHVRSLRRFDPRESHGGVSAGLFVAYSPFVEDQMYLWLRAAEPPSERDQPELRVALRWYGDGDRILVWETEPLVLESCSSGQWSPLLVDVPAAASDWNFLRFELLVGDSEARSVACTGYLLNAGQDGRENLEVLGLSPAAKPVQLANGGALPPRDGMAPVIEFRYVRPREGGSAGLVLLELYRLADVTELSVANWGLLPPAMSALQLPPRLARGPGLLALPSLDGIPTGARLFGRKTDGEIVELPLRQDSADSSANPAASSGSVKLDVPLGGPSMLRE